MSKIPLASQMAAIGLGACSQTPASTQGVTPNNFIEQSFAGLQSAAQIHTET